MFAKRAVRGHQRLAASQHDEGLALALVDHQAAGGPALLRAEWLPGDASRTAPQLSRLVREHRLGRVSCSGLVEQNDYSLVLVDTPEVPPAELRAAMRWRVKELIDFHVDDAVIDVFDVPGTDGRASRRTYAVAARQERVQRVVATAQGAGLALDVVDIPEFALRNLAARLPEQETGVALVHVDARHGLLSVTRRGALYFSRRMDGGRERLLHTGTTLTPAMEGQLDALTIEIQRSLDFYERHFAQPSIAAVVLAGMPVQVEGMTEYLQSQLGIPTRWLDLTNVLTMPTTPPPDVLARCTLAIGAALRDAERSA